ncbi:F0F1 ATP synthase subunit delta [Lapidilactobacillus concavus DSM 17758]|uniref:ATP synthase subunit delta n=1 Tax=Lapidilactobacillus concavus DSM 17758 TaxID=1423735 RepID=A0A0R1W629_9LACO|nr:ATP synthase F1 subunit delta [Lapidilactobacillus concavus]KRM12914.1 F0F1 ATP synthase subunit delta [Lapidilactobacillus concavus DSM 17758]GEL13197.1 ATP synthase subunit delta [Lapidilactobacillus concavus]
MKLDKYTVGKRYAKALFEYATETQDASEIYKELLALRQVFADDPDLGNILSDSRLSLPDKQKILATLKQSFSETLQHFLQLVFDYHRMNDIEFIIDEFERRYDSVNGRVLITATTAVPMDDDQIKRVGDAYLQRFSGNSVVVTNVVDQSIIGGMILQAQDRRIDGSVQTKLNRVRELLAQPLNN